MSAPTPTPPAEGWEDPYRPPRFSLSWLTVPLLLAVLYVLSLGPACRLAQRQTISWDLVHRIYLPVNVISRYPVVDRCVQWYIRDIWRVKATRSISPSP